MKKKTRLAAMQLSLWLMATLLSAHGEAASPIELKIHGTNLASATEVTLDGSAVPFSVIDDETLVLKLNGAPAKSARVVVLTPGGRVEQVLTLPSTPPALDPPLQLTEVMPLSGPQSGGSALVILGQGFKRHTRDLKVFFGGIQATDVAVNSEGRLTVTTPPHEGGTVDLEIKAGDGAVATLKQGFRYLPAPTLTGLTPSEGSYAGGTRVVIRGLALAKDGDLQIYFGRAPVKEIVSRSETAIEVVAPANIEGPVDLILTNPDGQTAMLPRAFTYLAAPTIRALDLEAR